MDSLLVFLNTIAALVTILLVWFKSNAFVEYVKLFGFKKLLFGYNEHNDLSFPQHLFIQFNQRSKNPIVIFIIGLITCPFCLGLWFSIFGSCLFLNNILLTPLLYLCVLGIYLFFNRLLD